MPSRTVTARLAALFLAVTLASACGDDPFVPELDDSLGIDLSAMTQTDSGLYIQDLVVGDGTVATTGHKVTGNYVGWLANGTKFDEGSLSFVLGIGQVVKGFDEGVMGMRVGGKRRMVLPPDLAYGSRGSGPIPPDATVVFEFELTAVE